MSYDEREIRVRKNYLEEQNPAICCVCFHSGEELLRELRQQRSVDIVVLSSQLEDMDGYEFLKRLNSLHNRPLLLLQGDDWYSDATASFLRPDGRQYLPERSSQSFKPKSHSSLICIYRKSQSFFLFLPAI